MSRKIQRQPMLSVMIAPNKGPNPSALADTPCPANVMDRESLAPLGSGCGAQPLGLSRPTTLRRWPRHRREPLAEVGQRVHGGSGLRCAHDCHHHLPTARQAAVAAVTFPTSIATGTARVTRRPSTRSGSTGPRILVSSLVMKRWRSTNPAVHPERPENAEHLSNQPSRGTGDSALALSRAARECRQVLGHLIPGTGTAIRMAPTRFSIASDDTVTMHDTITGAPASPTAASRRCRARTHAHSSPSLTVAPQE